MAKTPRCVDWHGLLAQTAAASPHPAPPGNSVGRVRRRRCPCASGVAVAIGLMCAVMVDATGAGGGPGLRRCRRDHCDSRLGRRAGLSRGGVARRASPLAPPRPAHATTPLTVMLAPPRLAARSRASPPRRPARRAAAVAALRPSPATSTRWVGGGVRRGPVHRAGRPPPAATASSPRRRC